MPHVRNLYYRSIECPMCKKKISKNSDKRFCCKECKDEWKLLNGELSPDNNVRVRGRDTSG